ncbi:MAG: CotH kinase family protein [Treponema sp.]|nr:CotH kinase family protein [Treponema sp.]
MKKSLSVLFIAAAVLIIAGCKTNVDSGDNPDPTIKIENEKIDNSLPDGETVYSSDGILSITPTKEGLLIKKNHPNSWEHNNIHVFQVSNGQENARIDNLDQYTNTFLYPFVKKGETYRVYIEKQETNWTNWGESAEVVVTAIGGYGNNYVNYNYYKYSAKNKYIAFTGLTFVYPEMNMSQKYFSGPVFNGALWATGVDTCYEVSYELEKSRLYINDRTNFLTNQTKVGISLNYNFSMYDYVSKKEINYACPVISSIIYNANFPQDARITLTGGKKIPRVDITSSNGYINYPTYHFGDSWKSATMTITDENGTVLLDNAACSLKDRGNSTKWTSKTPFSVKFEEKQKVLGMPKSKRWVLMANYFDRSLIRTEFAGYMGNNVFNSYWNASFKPVNVYINGNYYGTYDLGECNKIAKNRVNVQSLEDFADNDPEFSDVNHDGKVNIEDAGFMVEIDTAINWSGKLNRYNYKTDVGVDGGAAERIYFYSSEKCIPMTLKEPDFGDWGKYSEQKCEEYGKYAKSKIDAFEKMLYSSDFKTKYTDYIDALSFIDWYLVNEFGKNSDANFQKSVPVTYNPATGLLYMGPNWDFDLSLGNFNHWYDSDFGGTTVDDPTGFYIYGGRKGCDENALYSEVNNMYQVQSWWINRLMESSAFKKAVKARWNDRKLYLKNAINQQILEYANNIADYIPENEEHLPRLGQESWNGPSGYKSRKTYEDEISYLYNWCMARYQWMDKELNKW